VNREGMQHLEDVLAFAYIAVGNESVSETFLMLSLSNLRRLGGWRGDVFVVTDRVACVPSSATPVAVSAVPAEFDKEHATKYGKHFKQRLLELLPLSPRHEYVFYSDIDVFVGAPVFNFLVHAVSDFEEQHAAIGLLREGTGRNGQIEYNESTSRGMVDSTYHSGLFLISRKPASVECMQHWGKWYAGPRPKDQPQLSSSARSGFCNVSALPQEEYALPTANNSGFYWTFNHFTRTGRMKGHEGMHKEQLALAGRVLLGLSGSVAEHWWKLKSPLCPK